MNRRSFVSSLATTGVVAATSSPRLFAAALASPIKVGLIGCGWFGNVDLDALRHRSAIDVVSLCDVNEQALSKSLATVKEYQAKAPKAYKDYRDMLGAQTHDVVIVATPDHWHALCAIAALQTGADLLLEKPISVDVVEGEAILAAARKYDRVVQVNLQRRSSPIAKEAKAKYLDSGKIGRVGLVETYFYGQDDRRVIPSEPPPPHLDYEMWAGPAPMIDYVPPIADRGWRLFMEYGNGHTGDMGVHMLDMARMMLDLGWPESISASGGRYVFKSGTANRSDTQRCLFHYPDLDLSWEHRMWGKSPIEARHWTDNWGARFIGENGTLTVTSFSYEYVPSDGSAAEGRHMLSSSNDLRNVSYDSWLSAANDLQSPHIDDFLSARQRRARPAADIEEAHISSACCILANLSQELGRTLRYDPDSRSLPGDGEATERLARPYRNPWAHPDPDSV